jgi:hypothetical protein
MSDQDRGENPDFRPPPLEVGQIFDTGGGDLARITEMDPGYGGAAHFVWLDRNHDAWWTKRLIPVGWTLYRCPHPRDKRQHGSFNQATEWCGVCDVLLDC